MILMAIAFAALMAYLFGAISIAFSLMAFSFAAYCFSLHNTSNKIFGTVLVALGLAFLAFGIVIFVV